MRLSQWNQSCRLLFIGVLLVVLLPTPITAQPPARGQLYFWVWWHNLEGHWRELIDFTAEQKFDGVVIWGLQGWKGDGKQCREVVQYAHARNVKVIHGMGLNGYEEGKYIVGNHPEFAAKLPPELANTKKGKWTLDAIFCPSKPESLELLKGYLLQAASTGIDGFNFETADVDYVTCHCPACEKRFANADETEHDNKPISWSLEHLAFAAEVLSEKYPKLWLSCEFAMQRFGKPPYTDCQRILELNRRIDPRMTVVWSEQWAPPEEIISKLCAERDNIGFYIRSGAISGWNAKRILSAEELLPIAQRLEALNPVCIMYRGYQPRAQWAVNMGSAARILHKPNMTQTEVARIVEEFQRSSEKGSP